MSFIAKNPLMAAKLDTDPPRPYGRTRGLFPKEDGWYDINDDGIITKIGTNDLLDEKLERLQYYGNVNITPSNENLFKFTYDASNMTAGIYVDKDVEATDDYKNIVIPYKTIYNDNEYIVTSINTPGFMAVYDKIESLVIPSTIVTVGDYCYLGGSSLTELNLPDSITSLGIQAFTFANLKKLKLPINCKNLAVGSGAPASQTIEELILPTNIDKLNSNDLFGYYKLKYLYIPRNIRTLMEDCIFSCSLLEEVEIAYGCETISWSAFYNCQKLKRVKIPASVTSLGDTSDGSNASIFDSCPEDVTIICSKGSAAEEHAIKYGINYMYDETYETQNKDLVLGIVVGESGMSLAPTDDTAVETTLFNTIINAHKNGRNVYIDADASAITNGEVSGSIIMPLIICTDELIRFCVTDTKNSRTTVSLEPDDTISYTQYTVGEKMVHDMIDFPTYVDGYPSVAAVSEYVSNYAFTKEETDDAIDTAISTKQDKATTLEGYGITDAYTKAETDLVVSTKADYSYVTEYTYSKDETDVALANKMDKVTVIDTAYSGSIILEDNQDAQVGEVVALGIATPDVIEPTYRSSFSFISGDEPTYLAYAGTPIIWKGDDVDSDGVFIPQANTMYEVSVKYIGTSTGGEPVIVARVGAV